MIKYLIILSIWIISSSNAFAGFAEGLKAGSQAGDSWVRSYESARYAAIQERLERERRRTGIIDFIDSKRSGLVGERLKEIQHEIDASMKNPQR